MLKVYIDGASRGNPGEASYAYIIKEGNKTIVERYSYIGRATNNVAEYTALVNALEDIVKNFSDKKEVIIYSDSELLVKQLNGIYKVKDAKIKALYDKIKEISKNFLALTVIHIPREENRRADKLCKISFKQVNVNSNITN
jgi:ribonuclease HI